MILVIIPGKTARKTALSGLGISRPLSPEILSSLKWGGSGLPFRLLDVVLDLFCGRSVDLNYPHLIIEACQDFPDLVFFFKNQRRDLAKLFILQVHHLKGFAVHRLAYQVPRQIGRPPQGVVS